jgi:hypothetical protein
MSRVVQILENIDNKLSAIHAHLIAEDKIPSKTKSKKNRAERGVSQRLLIYWCKNPDAVTWTAKHLGEVLNCSKTSIIQSETWRKAKSQPKTNTMNCEYIEEITDRDQQ